jgi:hypothetical protein
MVFVYTINYGKEVASSSISDVYSYVITRNLLDYILKIVRVFIRLWGIQIYTALLFRDVVYTRYDVCWSSKWIDFTNNRMASYLDVLLDPCSVSVCCTTGFVVMSC